MNLRLTDTWRVLGRGQVQRKFAMSEQRGGGGVEWRWKPHTTLRGQALVGPGNHVMPEADYLGELQYAQRVATWTASVRYFDFTGARTTVVSPAVAWVPEGRLSATLRYAVSRTEAKTPTAAHTQTGHSGHIRAAYRVSPRLSVQAGYAGGVEDFENFSIDRVGDFRANTLSGGLRLDLPTLTAITGTYERQWRRGTLDMGRVTVSLLQSF